MQRSIRISATMIRKSKTWLSCLVVLGCMMIGNPVFSADNWPTWRGPTGDGIAPPGDYPVSWSPEQNVLWKVKLPAPGGSTPIVWGDRIIVTYVTAFEDGQNAVRCFDWQGQQLWDTVLGEAVPGKHRKASGCNPSPVTDGNHIFAYFKSGELACLDMDGKVLWKKNLQQDFAEDTLWWDLGTSPVLTDHHVVVAVIQSGPSYLAAFDKESGQLAWKQDRMLDAPEEGNQSYSTPVVADFDGQQRLVVLGADHVTAHDAQTGKEIWRVGGFNPEQNGYFRSIASAVVEDNVVVMPYARGKTLTALKLADGEILWQDDEISSDVPTPAALDGHVYVLADRGEVACLDVGSGERRWSVQTPRKKDTFSASPILTSKHLYVAREDGTTFVFDRQADHKLVATNEMDEFLVSTPVFSADKILLRTSDHLYCIGQ